MPPPIDAGVITDYNKEKAPDPVYKIQQTSVPRDPQLYRLARTEWYRRCSATPWGKKPRRKVVYDLLPGLCIFAGQFPEGGGTKA